VCKGVLSKFKKMHIALRKSKREIAELGPCTISRNLPSPNNNFSTLYLEDQLAMDSVHTTDLSYLG
jgi:hypothetical protein